MTKEGFLDLQSRIGRRLLFCRARFLTLILAASVMQSSVVAYADGPAGPTRNASPATATSVDELPSLALPSGTGQCADSGPGAACKEGTAAILTPGQASLPGGMALCPADPATPAFSSLSACDDVTLPSPASSASESTDPSSPTPVQPSVPRSSLGNAVAATNVVVLTADAAFRKSGGAVLLTATATRTVSGTGLGIEIFDRSTKTLIGACMTSSRCLVGYSATSGTHSIAAYVTPPSSTLPTAETPVTSTTVDVSWIDVNLSAALPAVVGPGKGVLLTASTSAEVAKLGMAIVFWDVTTARALTFCGHGTTCSTVLSFSIAGSHQVIAVVADNASSAQAPTVLVTSNTGYLTWLSVELVANTTYPRDGGVVNLTAVANADLTNTPWSLGIVDERGMLVGKPCKTGRTCSARVTLVAGPIPYFSAEIGIVPDAANALTLAGQLLRQVKDHAPLATVQAKSAAVQPTRLLWGVDSCKPVTGDSAGASGLYPQVTSILGRPDFWGRYLTTTGNCPGISSSEVAAAARNKLGILPIYNDYDCSAVAYWANGQAYAASAAAAATSLGIPKGTVLMIDIEPPGLWCSGGVDSGFIEGWFFGVSRAGYAPGFYGDGTSSSTFGQAFCTAVADRPVIGSRSFLWSFEPSLIDSYSKASAPGWAPNQVGCTGNMTTWQYELSSGANPDVDRDEALSKTPLWYP